MNTHAGHLPIQDTTTEAAYWRDRAIAAETVAYRDEMTGVLTRSGLFAHDAAGRLDAFVSVADVDGLKAMNDTHGHLAGDDLIRSVGAILSVVAAQAGGVVARTGGDEFVLITTQHPKTLDTAPFSIGTVRRTRGMSLDAAITAADFAMYAHKTSRKRARS